LSSSFNLNAYYKLYSPKLEIYDKDWGLIFTYDSFASSNPINLEYLDCENAVGSAGTWSCIINDYDRVLDRNTLGMSNRVMIYKGQDAAHYSRVFSGVCRYDENIRNRGDALSYLLTGYGSQYIVNERVVNFAKSAPQKASLTSTGGFVFDPSMQANNIVTSIISDPTSQPVAHPTIAESGGFTDLSGIEDRVDNFLPAIYLPYIDGNSALDQITSLIGAEWGVDKDNRFYLRFPDTGADVDTIIIKSAPDYVNDDPTLTSYMIGGEQRYGRSMRKEDGFANRLFALTSAQSVVNSASNATGGSETLHDKGIAQMVIPGSQKFRDLALSLSRVGAPDTSSDPYLHGSIVLDDGAESPNMKAKVGQFDILLENIPSGSQAGTVYSFNVTYADKVHVVPNLKYWIILHQIGVLNDQNNTVRWYHNNDFDTPDQFSAVKSPGTVDDDTNEEIGWVVNDTGPTYSYAAFSSLTHVSVAWDARSIDRWGLVDGFVNNQAISDFDTMNRYLYAILQFSAKPKLIYNLTQCTMPLGSDIIPGQLVQIVDDVSGLTALKQRYAEVMSVRYEWGSKGGSAATGSTAAGISSSTVSLLGYYDFLREEPQPVV